MTLKEYIQELGKKLDKQWQEHRKLIEKVRQDLVDLKAKLDRGEIISNWQISGTDKTVAIDKENITINSNTVLKYKLDTFSKVIIYEIGDMKGSSHYRFS